MLMMYHVLRGENCLELGQHVDKATYYNCHFLIRVCNKFKGMFTLSDTKDESENSLSLSLLFSLLCKLPLRRTLWLFNNEYLHLTESCMRVGKETVGGRMASI